MAACVLLNFRTVCAIIFFKPGAYFLLVLNDTSELYACFLQNIRNRKDISKTVLKFSLLETDKHCDMRNCLLKHFKMREKMVPDACLGDGCDLQFG